MRIKKPGFWFFIAIAVLGLIGVIFGLVKLMLWLT